MNRVKKIQTFTEIGEISLIKSSNYMVQESIWFRYFCMRSIVYFREAGTVSRLFLANFLKLEWLDSFHQRDVPEIRSASDNSSSVSGTITLHLRI